MTDKRASGTESPPMVMEPGATLTVAESGDSMTVVGAAGSAVVGAAGSQSRANARLAILSAARAEIADTGDFTVNAVAARAGVSRQAVQYHFGGARGLRQALASEGLLERQPDEPTRERLVDAAARMFSRPGGAVASIDAIAAEAGMTKGAIYHHFADRTDLLRAVAARISPVDEIVGALERSEDEPLREGLIALTTAYFNAMRARVGMIRSLAVNASTDPELGTIVMGEIVGRGAPRMFAWFDRRVARGELKPGNVPFLMQALFGPVFLSVVVGEQVFAALESIGIRPATEHPDEYVDFLLAGLVPEHPRVTAPIPRAQPSSPLTPSLHPEVDR